MADKTKYTPEQRARIADLVDRFPDISRIKLIEMAKTKYPKTFSRKMEKGGKVGPKPRPKSAEMIKSAKEFATTPGQQKRMLRLQ